MDRYNLIKTIIFMKLKIFWGADILITTRCSAGCRFCIYNDIKKEEIQKTTIDKGIKLLEKVKIKQIRISGGEPFESYENLLYTFDKIKKILPTEKISIITSSNWAKNENIVNEKIGPLKDMGLDTLTISIDSFHLEKIGSKNYFFILEYLKKHGINSIINVRYNDDLQKHMDVFERIKQNYDVKIFSSIINRVGGATKLDGEETAINLLDFRKYLKKYESPYDFKKLLRPVSACLYLTLFPNGDMHLCCIKRENTKICNINNEDFFISLKRFNKNWMKNIYRIVKKPAECNNCKISK